MKNKLTYPVIGFSLAVVLFISTVAFANQTSGEIHACVSNANGSVRIINPLLPGGCKKSETLVVWNKEGVAGPQGEVGPTGLVGPQGEPGTDADESRIAALEARIAALEADGGGGGEVTIDTAVIRSSQNSPDATSLIVEEDSAESDEYVVHIFDIEVDEDSSDLMLKDAYVWVTITNPGNGIAMTVEDVVADINLTINGQVEQGIPASFGTADGEIGHLIGPGESNRTGFRFEFTNLVLPNDALYPAEIALVFEGTDAGQQYVPRVTVATDVVGSEWELEGVTSTNVLTGTDTSETHSLATEIPIISDVSSSVDRSEDAKSGVISFEFTIEADAKDVALSLEDIIRTISGTNPAIASGYLTKVAGDATLTGADWLIQEGDAASFVLDTTFITTSSADIGAYRVTLDSILGVEVDETSGALNLTF